MIFWILLLMTEWLFAVSADEAVLVREPRFDNAKLNYPKKNENGMLDDCFRYKSNEEKWTVIDLQNNYQIQKLMISKDNKVPGLNSLSFFVGDEFMPCLFQRQVEKYSPCKLAVTVTQSQQEIVCDGKGVKGQYLAVVENRASNNKKFSSFDLCQFDVYGTLDSDKVKRQKPTMTAEEESVPQTSANDFKIIKEIRNGVDSVIIPEYSSPVYYVNENCEPIIWDKEQQLAFGVACQTPDGKGRITLFGKEGFFLNLLKKRQGNLDTNIMKWLSPNNPKPNIIQSNKIKTIDDIGKLIQKGDIVDFDLSTPKSLPIIQEMKSLLLNGSIAISVDGTFWGKYSEEARKSYLEILNIFNVDINPQVINYGPEKKLTFSEEDLNDDLFDIEGKVRKMSLNHDYLLKYGVDIRASLSETPNTLLENTKIKSYLETIIRKYDELLKWICPCRVNPTKDINDRKIVDTIGSLMKIQLLVNSGYKLPCVDSFPGDFSTPVQNRNVKLSVDSQLVNVLNPTGYYLEAGSTLDYEIINSQQSWEMTIGCHSDKLDDRRPEWYRYPSISIRVPLIKAKGSVFSPYGGNIWLSNQKANGSITITLKGVVETPFFNVRDPQAIENWNKQRTNKGLWAQIAGDNMVFCVESKLLRSFDGTYLLDNLRNNWDRLMKMDFEFKSLDWRDRRPEIVVLDIQISIGYGHSGYPIVAFSDWFYGIFDLESIREKGSWGMCHEIGHNMQESSWTYDGTGEVTNNLFCLFNYEKLWHIPYYGSDKVKLFRGNDRTPDVKAFLDGGAKFDQWKADPFTALLIYAQMANHFGFGFYQKVFKYYKDYQIKPAEERDKIMTWINVTSTLSGYNLLPLFDFWGFPYLDSLERDLSQLPCLYPDDFYRNISESRKTYVEKKYKACHSKSSLYEDISFKTLDWDMRPNNIKEIT